MTRSDRLHELFHALQVIRQIVRANGEGIEPAIASAARDRAVVDQLQRNALLVNKPEHLVSACETIEASVQQLHTICHFLISERETLGQALESIRRELALVNIPPRTRNLGDGARGTDAKGGD